MRKEGAALVTLVTMGETSTEAAIRQRRKRSNRKRSPTIAEYLREGLSRHAELTTQAADDHPSDQGRSQLDNTGEKGIDMER